MRPHQGVVLYSLTNISSRASRASSVSLSDRFGKVANLAYVSRFVDRRDGQAES